MIVEVLSNKKNIDKKVSDFFKLYDRLYADAPVYKISLSKAIALYMTITDITDQMQDFLVSNEYINTDTKQNQNSFMIRELACMSVGKTGGKIFRKYIQGFMNPESENSKGLSDKIYTFEDSEKTLQKCNNCQCLKRGCQFAEILKQKNR